jgi:hypothetical protein
MTGLDGQPDDDDFGMADLDVGGRVNTVIFGMLMSIRTNEGRSRSVMPTASSPFEASRSSSAFQG